MKVIIEFVKLGQVWIQKPEMKTAVDYCVCPKCEQPQ